MSEGSINDEACRMFARQCFQHYTKPFCDCAMITEGEFCNSVEVRHDAHPRMLARGLCRLVY